MSGKAQPVDTGRRPWRVGGHWGVTIVAEGYGPIDEDGRRAGDVLIGMALTPESAALIVEDHNAVLAVHRIDP